MATTRAPRAPKAAAAKQPAPVITRRTAFILLVAGLVLSAYNLALMTAKSGSLAGITDSWIALKDNYAAMRTTKIAPTAEPATAQPAPMVLSSVVSYRTSEETFVRENLVAPLLSYYEVAPSIALKALLIERKNAASRDVSVRLFFEDGTETAYLWPSTNAAGGRWVPPCAQTIEDVSEKLPFCPERFRAQVAPTPAE